MTLDVGALGLRTAQSGAAKEGRQNLGQQDFLTLLVTQLRNQDPLNPLDNEAFVAQLAQFSTVSGITEMNGTLAKLAEMATADSRALAPQWLGKQVGSEAGLSGIVTSVSISADASLLLTLNSGATLPVAQVTSLS